MKERSTSPALSQEVLVVTSSPLLRRRIERPLSAQGFPVRWMAGVRELLHSKRQRPWLLCFLDARGPNGDRHLSDCSQRRPGERYVLVRGCGNGGGSAPLADEASLFGCVHESFVENEVLTWSRRALAEARLMRGDQSLEDLLYSRFRAFLQNLGPTSMTKVHDLVRERVERPLLKAVLEWTSGNQTKAAQILGIHRNTLRSKIRSLGLGPAPTEAKP
jgi:Fis family transcriptional regulator, factor for inversion stimulation protein